MRSRSILFGSSWSVRARRWPNRRTWVSTKMPCSSSGKQFAMTTLAVFRATPGRVVSSSMVRGTLPPKSSTILCAAPMMDFVFCRKNPVDRTISSTRSGSAAARSSGEGYRSKSSGVTLFTFSSVVWAERMVAIRSS